MAILLIVLRLTVFDNSDSVFTVVAAVIDNSVAALVAAVAVTLFVFYIGRLSGHSDTTFMRGGRLKRLLTSDAAISRTWKIRARTGSYFVRETLPKLNDRAVISIVLMDPSRAVDLDTYRALRPAEEQPNWDPVRIKADIIVSIIRLIQYKNLRKFMTINLYTSPTTSTQSLDISDFHCFLCGQGKKDIALVSPASDELYDRFIDDFTVVSTLARGRSIPKLSDLGSPTEAINGGIIDKCSPTFQSWFGIDLTEPSLRGRIIENSSRGHHYG